MIPPKCPDCSKEMVEGVVFAQAAAGEGGAPGLFWQNTEGGEKTCLIGYEVRPQSADGFRCEKDSMITLNYIGRELKTEIIKCPECQTEMVRGKVFPLDEINEVSIWWRGLDTNKDQRIDSPPKQKGSGIKSILKTIFAVSSERGAKSARAYQCKDCKVVMFQYPKK